MSKDNNNDNNTKNCVHTTSKDNNNDNNTKINRLCHLCNPLSTSDDLCFLGTFHMISLTGFYTNNNLSASSPPNNIPYPSFAIQFTRGSPPKLFEGLIGGKLIGVEPVQVMASIVKKRTCST